MHSVVSVDLSVPAYGFMQSQPIIYKTSQTALQSAFYAYAWSAPTLGDAVFRLRSTYSRLQVGEVQIIVRAWQCHAPTSIPHLPEIRCKFAFGEVTHSLVQRRGRGLFSWGK